MANDFAVKSDQWDIRVNIPSIEWLDNYISGLDDYCEKGSVKYLHVSGIEIGTAPDKDSFNQRHVHIALVLFNYTSKRSIVNRFTVKNYGYYVEPRDKTLPISGWIAYHSKRQTKIRPDDGLIYIYGDLPRSRIKRTMDDDTPVEAMKKNKKRDDWRLKKQLMINNDWDRLDDEFPGFIYSSMGQAMKRDIMKQANDDYTKPLQGKLNNVIIWGPSGSGKSSSIALMYPNCYKKQKGSQYWDAYDKTNPDHSIVWIDEMSKETLKTFSGKMDGGFEFLKELGDRYAVTVDEKYTKGYKIRPKRIIITMNEHPTSLLPERAVEVNKQALFRKFKIMYVNDWLILNGLVNTETGCRYIPLDELDEELIYKLAPDLPNEYSRSKTNSNYTNPRSTFEEFCDNEIRDGLPDPRVHGRRFEHEVNEYMPFTSISGSGISRVVQHEEGVGGICPCV
jgi:hypothetical protein